MEYFSFGCFVTLMVCILGYTFKINKDFVPKSYLFERGHMVQCVGKTGYYWECEE